VPEWRVAYEIDDLSEAMAACADDLTDLDPNWIEYLDFSVLRAPEPTRLP